MTLTQRDGKIYAPLAELKQDPRNPKEITAEKFALLRASLEKEGQLIPLLIDMRPNTEGTVLGGNMTLRALKELGRAEAWVEPRSPASDAHAFELSTKHNMGYGVYITDALKTMAEEFQHQITLSELSFPVMDQSLDSLFEEMQTADVPDPIDETPHEPKLTKCPNCGVEFQAK